jgi:hypothetical protein
MSSPAARGGAAGFLSRATVNLPVRVAHHLPHFGDDLRWNRPYVVGGLCMGRNLFQHLIFGLGPDHAFAVESQISASYHFRHL